MAAPDDGSNTSASSAAFATLVTALAAQYAPPPSSAPTAAEVAEQEFNSASGASPQPAAEGSPPTPPSDGASNQTETPTAVKESAAEMSVPMLPLSLALMSSGSCTQIAIPVARLAEFLNELGAAAVQQQYADVQAWVQQRKRRRGGCEKIWGLILDADLEAEDPLAVIVDAGLPLPTTWWRTIHGWKAIWVFDRPADSDTFDAIAQQFTIAVPGGDPKSWSLDQAQHLPIVLKSTDDGVIEVKFLATQTNAQPLRIADYLPELPMRLQRALGSSRCLSAGERPAVEDYLAELGTPAPEETGSRSGPYACCPVSEQHDRPCFYIYRQENGSIDATCIGGHSGELTKFWSEPALYELATGKHISDAGIDALHDVPINWAGQSYIEDKLAEAFATEPQPRVLVATATTVWMRAHASKVILRARRLAESEGIVLTTQFPLNAFLRLCCEKIDGFDSTGPCRVAFDAVNQYLTLLHSNGSTQRIKTEGESLSVAPHLHEWKASRAHYIYATITSDKKTETKSISFTDQINVNGYASHWNKGMSGSADHLAALGVPILHHFPLPIAFEKDSCSIDPQTKCISITRTARMRAGDPKFDALDFFTKLQREGKLPLATEEDVPRYLMGMASPLVRRVAPGLLGVYVFEGPSGSGKEYMVIIINDTWEHSILIPTTVSFELHDVDDLEMNRGFHAASSAVYMRVKEAGKSIDKINSLIRFAATKHVTARGMQKDARQIPNSFTYLADTVEGLPERKEIARRTVVIGTRNIGDDVSKGEIRQQIIDRAPDIIAYLKAKIESQSPEWFLNQTNTQSRQVAQAALAKLFGATLPEVKGGSTDELFEYMLSFIKEHGEQEGKEQLEAAKSRGGKDGKETILFPSYGLGMLIGIMKDQVRNNCQEFFKQHGTTRSLEMFLKREANYHEVENGQLSYLRVEINGAPYAFKLVKGKRNFVLFDELKYCDRMGIEPIGPAKKKEAGEEQATAGDASPKADVSLRAAPTQSGTKQPQQEGGPMRFSSATLRSSKKQEGGAADATKRK